MKTVQVYLNENAINGIQDVATTMFGRELTEEEIARVIETELGIALSKPKMEQFLRHYDFKKKDAS